MSFTCSGFNILKTHDDTSCFEATQEKLNSSPLVASHLSPCQEVTHSSWWQIKRQEAARPGDGLTGAVLVVSVPGDGGYEVDAGESGHEALKTVSLAAL